MNELLEQKLEDLTENPMVSDKDLEILKELFKNFNLERKIYRIVGVYLNGSYVAEDKVFEEVPYYVWYHTKYKKDRKILIDGALLNYQLSEADMDRLNNRVYYLKNDKNVIFKRD